MKYFLITLIIFGFFILLGQFICSFVNTEYIKLDIMFLFGVIACSVIRVYEILKDQKEQKDNEDDYIRFD